MQRSSKVFRVLLLLLLFLGAFPASAEAATPYQAHTRVWRGANGDFGAWVRSGVSLGPGGALQFDPATARADADPYAAGAYNGRNFYNGGSFLVGEATSPVASPGFSFTEAIPSWNATTPAGSWIETRLRVRIGSRWSKWYNMGVWASGTGAVERHSVSAQGDADARVAVDTLILDKNKRLVAGSYQLKLRFFSTGGAVPGVRGVAVTVSTTPTKPGALLPGERARWNKRLGVPACSQMVYPDGGEVWCSPTSAAMVLGYWAGEAGPCEPRVRAAVAGVHDWIYRGHGNWPFNTAYAASQGYESFVARFSSLRQVEEWIAAGVPVIASVAWGRNQLTNAPIRTAGGHLLVVVGFDAAGNPIVHDPAAASNQAVGRTYLRSEFEPLWLEHSGGTVYLIYPAGRAVPAL